MNLRRLVSGIIGIIIFGFSNQIVFAMHNTSGICNNDYSYTDGTFATVSYKGECDLVNNKLPKGVDRSDIHSREGMAKFFVDVAREINKSCIGGEVSISAAGSGNKKNIMERIRNNLAGGEVFKGISNNDLRILAQNARNGYSGDVVYRGLSKSPSGLKFNVTAGWNGDVGGAGASATFAFDDCPLLEGITALCANDGVNNVCAYNTSPSHSNLLRASGNSYSLTWRSPFADNCSLTGPNITSDTVVGSTPSPLRDLPAGIYEHKFHCSGVLNGVISESTGNVDRSITVYVGDIPSAPTIISLTVSPNPINKGQKAKLSWEVINANSISINQGVGNVPAKGDYEVSPAKFTTYTITAKNTIYPQLSTIIQPPLLVPSVTLKVLAPGTKPVPIVPGVPEIPTAPPDETPSAETPSEPAPDKIDVKVNDSDGPITVAAPANLNLSWNLDRYCLAYGSWFGFKTKAGSQIINVAQAGDYTYKLYCPGFNSTSDQVSVKVLGGGNTAGVPGTPDAPAIPFPVSEASISLDGKNFLRSIRVTQGKPVSLWLSAGYDIDGNKKASRSEDGGWSSLISSGGRCDFNYDLKGNPTFEASVFDPKDAKECTVPLEEKVFSDPPGVYRFAVLRLVQSDGKVSNTGYVNIAIQPPPPPTGPPAVDFKINGVEGSLNLGAPASYNLTWQVSNADSCEASGSWSGSKGIAGSESLVSSIKRDFEYTLTCKGKLGTTAKTIALKVSEIPVCDFTALPKVLGQSAFISESVLSWKCQFANSCSISPSVNANVDTFGSVRVSPKTTTTYTLNCQNLEGKASFDQTVEVR